jgi:pre-mRNA-splicing helicase BRR2
VLSLLKDESMKDRERQSEVDKLIGKVTDEKFNKLVNLGKQITDFVEGGGEAEEGNDVDDEEEKLDEEMAVVFDDDSEEEGEEDVDEIRDEDDEEDDGLGGVEAMATSKLAKGADSDEEGMGDEEEGTLNVKEIDAHWLQRHLSQVLSHMPLHMCIYIYIYIASLYFCPVRTFIQFSFFNILLLLFSIFI